ncbi:cytochrome P450 [Actinoplanes sp. TFC3]|uniref:cytochrome P450 family protein n=1 Tax=Actinoplanes sp. TFC3 TaxID=1710355 RepID=UPI00082A670B|nr:cytochrome P450 [Actinoplanes sp. TFC3]
MTVENGSAPIQVDDAAFSQDPHALYDMLRIESPVREVVSGDGLKVWLVTRYDDAKAALSDVRLSKNVVVGERVLRKHSSAETAALMFTAELSAHMLNTDPPDHTRLKKLVNKAFTTRTVERLRPRITEITADLLDAMAKQDTVDLLAAFASPLPITVICELLGVPFTDREKFQDWVAAQLSTDAERVQEAAPALLGYMNGLIESKRQAPGDDLLTALVQASADGDRLTQQELLSMAFLLLVAGHETTVNLIGNGMFALLQHPEQAAALRADRALLPKAIDEFLRYEGPVNTASFRFTTAPVELGGVTIPEDELVLISLASANRDEQQFPGAAGFDITRQTNGNLAFGHGIHYCIGAPLARLEAEIAFGALLDRFPGLQLDADPATLRWRPGAVIRGLETLPVKLH